MRSLTLASRLTAIVVVSLLAVWLALVVSFYAGRDWEEENFWPTPGRIAAIVSAVEAASPEQRSDILAALNTRTLTVRVEDTPNRRPLADPAKVVDEELIRKYAEELRDRAFTVSQHSVRLDRPNVFRIWSRARQALEVRIGLETGNTLVIESTPPLLVTPFGLPTGIGAGLIGTGAALIALIILFREIRPLTQLARAVDHMDLDGNPIALPNVKRQSAEIRALVVAFDRLQTRLSQLLRARMAMLGGISHDVRTFATRLRLRVDSIPDEQQRRRAIADIADMIRLLDDALLASRVGAGDLLEELLEFDEIARNEVEDRRSAGAPVDLLVTSEAEGITILGDRLALRRVIANLIENAIKYGENAHVTVSASAQYAILSVDDVGPGIPPELEDVLTEPFVRAEVSRSRDTGGAGLGLAVVRNLVEAHGGILKFETRSGQGSRVTFQIPRFQM
ncbi:HAMP domain-containing histidine kinase [Agrobacterium sp. B1(2019)]|nr:HAMP domain-containing histidine kinase [Agrobacterium sp. B1(2019)]